MRVIEESLRPLARERNITPLSSNPVDQQARDEDGTDERGDDTDNQRCSETAHGTVAEDQQDNTRDDSRQVTVDDGRIGFRETILDSQRQPFATAKLLLDTFVNNDVASTAIPIVSTIPAIPGKVNTAPNETRIPINRKTLVNSATSDNQPAVL